jgi:hypothetical protein
MTANQFMIYHLYEWDDAKQKFKKKPVGLQGQPLMTGGGIETSSDVNAVIGTINALNADNPVQPYRLGLWITPGMFFLDMDEDAVQGQQLTASATEFCKELVEAGCYFEASTSGRGAHVIGRYTGELPAHTIQRPLNEPSPHALYTSGRGCVLSDVHAGSWDVDATAPLVRLLEKFFKPRTSAATLHAVTAGPRPEWRGPTDDDALILRMLGATGSTLGRLRGAVPLIDLWNGRCAHNNETDYALAAHLAFWTGCDGERMERLMRRSPLAAHRVEKWDSHSTYLRELTINGVIETTDTVYAEPVRVDTASVLLGRATPPPLAGVPLGAAVVTLGEQPATDWFDYVEQTTAAINTAGTLRELYETIFPGVAAMSVPVVHANTLAQVANRKLESMGSKQPISTIKALLSPPRDLAALLSVDVPEWAASLVYVRKSDEFYDTSSGAHFNQTGLRMSYSRFMPMKASGVREDPVQKLMDVWNITNVDELQYRPDQPPIFEHAGRTVANEFRASTMPTPVVGSAECSACIELFTRHLAQLVNQRGDVYAALLGWIAFNVQHPGSKIGWAPLIKGVGGDGKSIIGDLLFAAMGEANVKITSPSTISNGGGFTDWAMGACVNLIEEIRLEGKERRKLYNAMKTITGDRRINPNRKGKASVETYANTMNHMAFTNYEDAMPMDNDDRRWGIIFTPWANASQAAVVKGLRNADDLPAFFKRLGASMRGEPGAWRSWLMGIDLSSFDPEGRAPWTSERDVMVSSSEDYTEQTIRDCIERGCTGVNVRAFSSVLLMQRVSVALGHQPDTRSWNRMLTDLGYRQHSVQIWWSNRSHRVWVKEALTKDEILEILTRSAFAAT